MSCLNFLHLIVPTLTCVFFARNLFEKLQRATVSVKRAEKRSDIEDISLRENVSETYHQVLLGSWWRHGCTWFDKVWRKTQNVWQNCRDQRRKGKDWARHPVESIKDTPHVHKQEQQTNIQQKPKHLGGWLFPLGLVRLFCFSWQLTSFVPMVVSSKMCWGPVQILWIPFASCSRLPWAVRKRLAWVNFHTVLRLHVLQTKQPTLTQEYCFELCILMGSHFPLQKCTDGVGLLCSERIHPQKLTWNLKMNPWKRRFLLKTIIFRFHVSFRGNNHQINTHADRQHDLKELPITDHLSCI